MTMDTQAKTDEKNVNGSFADLLQDKIVKPVKERFEKQNTEISECRDRIEAMEKKLQALEKALSEIDWGE